MVGEIDTVVPNFTREEDEAHRDYAVYPRYTGSKWEPTFELKQCDPSSCTLNHNAVL